MLRNDALLGVLRISSIYIYIYGWPTVWLFPPIPEWITLWLLSHRSLPCFHLSWPYVNLPPKTLLTCALLIWMVMPFLTINIGPFMLPGTEMSWNESSKHQGMDWLMRNVWCLLLCGFKWSVLLMILAVIQALPHTQIVWKEGIPTTSYSSPEICLRFPSPWLFFCTLRPIHTLVHS